ncbi:MAG TPA: rRNA maturation RNase YbeY [bacterium]|nr:rRNA maturation RNase YbeY [bacterium]
MPVEVYSRKNRRLNTAALKSCLASLLRGSKRGRAELELSFVGSRRIRELNRRHRRVDKVTDVLSFPLEMKEPPKDRPWHLGEIVICTQVASAQARRAGRSLTQQALRLAVHGFVHLHGLDHEEGERQAKAFEALERKYLQRLHRKGSMKWDGSLRL